jgi:hypothetical protein
LTLLNVAKLYLDITPLNPAILYLNIT